MKRQGYAHSVAPTWQAQDTGNPRTSNSSVPFVFLDERDGEWSVRYKGRDLSDLVAIGEGKRLQQPDLERAGEEAYRGNVA